MADEPMSFDDVKARLDEIADEVNAEGISLDDALALYEEAVKLGLAACDLSEKDILEIKEDSDEAMARLEELKREGGITDEDIARAKDAAEAEPATDGSEGERPDAPAEAEAVEVMEAIAEEPPSEG